MHTQQIIRNECLQTIATLYTLAFIAAYYFLMNRCRPIDATIERVVIVFPTDREKDVRR